MELVEIPIEHLCEAPWNANTMTEVMSNHLEESLVRHGIVQNLVVRRVEEDKYEVIAGGKRLGASQKLGATSAPCLVVHLNDAHARLLSQALNRIHGEDDVGLKAMLIKDILKDFSQDEILTLLPETRNSLEALANLGQESLADHLRAWQDAQAARLRHLQVQLTASQLEVVEEALERALADCKPDPSNPNRRGNALHRLCVAFLKDTEDDPE